MREQELLLTSTFSEFVSEKMKQMVLTIAWNVNIRNATESYTLNGKHGRFYVTYVLPW